MGVLIISLMLLFLRCQVCRGEMVTAQLGDFIELYSGLKNCDNANKSKIIVWYNLNLSLKYLFVIIILNVCFPKGDFSRCTSAVVNTATLTKFSDTWTQLCGNKQAYLDCWNPVVEKSKACNFRTNDGFPVVYKASFNGLCGTDNGNANAGKTSLIVDTSTWMTHCKRFRHQFQLNS